MRFKSVIAAAAAAVIAFSSVSAFAAAETIIINGEAASIPAEMGSIKEMDDRTFVPIRFVMEHLGCSVNYIDAEKSAVITSSDCTYIVQEGNRKLFVIPDNATDASPVEMDTAAFIDEAEGRTYIPIRFLAEAIGYTVGWDEETQTVTLNK